ncbi:MAG: DUF885 family protein [Segetibacter sp.]
MTNITNLSNVLHVTLITLLSIAAKAQTTSSDSKDWVTKSNLYTKNLIDIDQKYSPEFGSEQGLAFYDTLIAVPTLLNQAAKRKKTENAVAQLKSAKLKESNLAIKQDLDILIKQTEHDFKIEDYNLNKAVAFLNPTRMVFSGLQILLDDQTPSDRRKAAVVRLNKYAGLQNGYRPMSDIFKDRTIQQMSKPGIVYPSKQAREVALSRNASMVSGIAVLFKKYNILGWESAYNTIKEQLEAYDGWIKANLLPKARSDFRLPQEEYKLALEGYGIEIPRAQVATMAHTMFSDIQNQMKVIAVQVAQKYKLPSADYREVIKYLKKDQLVGDSIMVVYKRHLADIEEIIRKERLVTLPTRPAIIRLASEAETAQQPAQHMVPPPFLNNTGQRWCFCTAIKHACANR